MINRDSFIWDKQGGLVTITGNIDGNQCSGVKIDERSFLNKALI